MPGSPNLADIRGLARYASGSLCSGYAGRRRFRIDICEPLLRRFVNRLKPRIASDRIEVRVHVRPAHNRADGSSEYIVDMIEGSHVIVGVTDQRARIIVTHVEVVRV